MTPSERSMPVIEIGGRRGAWSVRLPGGVIRTVARRDQVVELVRREAPGSSLKFLDPTPTRAGRSAGIGLLASRGVRPGRRRSEDGT